MKLNRIIPKYAVWPVTIMLLLNCFTYFLSPIWTDELTHHTLTSNLDKMMPFIPVFVVPYILAYAQWIYGFAAVARTDEEFCKNVIYGEIAAKIIACFIFFIFPTTMQRAVFEDTNIFTWGVALIYKLDAPTRLFPSIHCLESWVCLRSSFNRKYFSSRYTVVMGITTVIIFLSTLFIKQHVIVDVLGGVVCAELGILILKILKKQF